jgi:hypothetical protein
MQKGESSYVGSYSQATLLEKPDKFFSKENKKSLTKVTGQSIIYTKPKLKTSPRRRCGSKDQLGKAT